MICYKLADGAAAPAIPLHEQARRDGLSYGSPWNGIDFATYVGDGIWFVETPSHGGFFLRRDLADLVPVEVVRASWLGDAQWFEEDCDALWVAIIFADRVTQKWRDAGNELVAKVARNGSDYYKPDAMHAALKARHAMARVSA